MRVRGEGERGNKWSLVTREEKGKKKPAGNALKSNSRDTVTLPYGL